MKIKHFKQIVFYSLQPRLGPITLILLFLMSSLLATAPREEASEPGEPEASVTEVSNPETGSEAVAPPPSAQASGKNPDDWQFRLVPLYLWGMGISGETTIGDRTAPIDIGFDDILDNLQFIFTVHFEARKGRWGGFGDYTYASMASDVKQLPTGAINVEMLLQLVEGGGTFEVVKGFQVLGGVRYVDLNLDTRFAEGPTLEMAQDWISPIGGVRFFKDISKRVAFIGRADLGGYSTSKSSDFTWNLSGLVNIRLTHWASLLAGYRALSLDYKTRITPNRDFKFDVIMQGPMFALGFNF